MANDNRINNTDTVFNGHMPSAPVSSQYTHVTKPIQIHNYAGTSGGNNIVTYIECIDCGKTTNFGPNNDEVNNYQEFITKVSAYLKDMEERLANAESTIEELSLGSYIKFRAKDNNYYITEDSNGNYEITTDQPWFNFMDHFVIDIYANNILVNTIDYVNHTYDVANKSLNIELYNARSTDEDGVISESTKIDNVFLNYVNNTERTGAGSIIFKMNSEINVPGRPEASFLFGEGPYCLFGTHNGKVTKNFIILHFTQPAIINNTYSNCNITNLAWRNNDNWHNDDITYNIHQQTANHSITAFDSNLKLELTRGGHYINVNNLDDTNIAYINVYLDNEGEDDHLLIDGEIDGKPWYKVPGSYLVEGKYLEGDYSDGDARDYATENKLVFNVSAIQDRTMKFNNNDDPDFEGTIRLTHESTNDSTEQNNIKTDIVNKLKIYYSSINLWKSTDYNSNTGSTYNYSNYVNTILPLYMNGVFAKKSGNVVEDWMSTPGTYTIGFDKSKITSTISTEGDSTQVTYTNSCINTIVYTITDGNSQNDDLSSMEGQYYYLGYLPTNYMEGSSNDFTCPVGSFTVNESTDNGHFTTDINAFINWVEENDHNPYKFKFGDTNCAANAEALISDLTDNNGLDCTAYTGSNTLFFIAPTELITYINNRYTFANSSSYTFTTKTIGTTDTHNSVSYTAVILGVPNQTNVTSIKLIYININ